MAQGRHRHGERAAVLTLVVLVAAFAGGCGTRVRSQLSALSPTTSAPTVLPPSSTSTSTTVPPQIATNWETFFNGRTPLAQRVALLENGPQYEQAIITASKNPLQAQATAKVTSVKLTAPDRATVTYDVLVLKGSTGIAVLQDGVWKVSDQSFCGLVSLEGIPIPGC